MSESSKSKVGLLTAFQVAAVWFGAHVGGGFATGNQTMNFFVKYGWHSIWLPAVIVIIIGLTYKESLILAKNYGTYNYKSWAKKMYEPYDKVFSIIFEIGYLMIVLLGTGGSIAGSASLMENYGVNYLVGVLITGGIFYILTIYGSELIRKASTIITILILIFLTVIVVTGIKANLGNLSQMVSTQYSPSSFGTVLYSGFRYAGYQAFVVAIVLSASDTLKSDNDINKSMFLGVILNGVMITLSCIMLLAWMPGTEKETIPILYICKLLNSDFLLFSYSIVLFLAFVSTGIGCVFGAVARFENVIKKPIDMKKRRGAISFVCMVLSMAISLFGLTNIVVVGYGYVGIIGIFAVVIPCIVVGRIKNSRFKKCENSKLKEDSLFMEEGNSILQENIDLSQGQGSVVLENNISGEPNLLYENSISSSSSITDDDELSKDIIHLEHNDRSNEKVSLEADVLLKEDTLNEILFEDYAVLKEDTLNEISSEDNTLDKEDISLENSQNILSKNSLDVKDHVLGKK